MLTRCHWLAASGSQGKPPSSQVRDHSMTTQSAARPNIARRRSIAPRPMKRGIAHHTARYQAPTQRPTTGPSRNMATQFTWCIQFNITVQATTCAPSTVIAYMRKAGLR